MAEAVHEKVTDDLDGYASPKAGISGVFESIEQRNDGKKGLDRQEEYIFELVERKLLKGVAGFKKEEKVDKILLTWKEIKTENLVQNSFRIDNPVWNANRPNFQSPVISFFEAIDQALPKDPDAVKRPGFWGPKFIVGMKIRARVRLATNGDGTLVPGKYVMELATVRAFKN